ncbi:hypothetical protein LV457_01160 [Mycobacterium sp. MYCO198283]|uniref:glycoside hydrolase family 71 protein n=1 Tax=Mycobacterium sp. MYCO198283 TaxID=2883505 RepID=UPI001E46550D|nr:glycoside hydrolase family 71 protein [Mycobacterium sp. MYCO198283]MCG5430910.1 hypothetical protein [Mycobacterium sp. MYCO198283]
MAVRPSRIDASDDDTEPAADTDDTAAAADLSTSATASQTATAPTATAPSSTAPPLTAPSNRASKGATPVEPVDNRPDRSPRPASPDRAGTHVRVAPADAGDTSAERRVFDDPTRLVAADEPTRPTTPATGSPVAAPADTGISASITDPTPVLPSDAVAPAQAALPPAIVEPVRVLAGALDFLAVNTNPDGGDPVQSPLAWATLAWVRRQSESPSTEQVSLTPPADALATEAVADTAPEAIAPLEETPPVGAVEPTALIADQPAALTMSTASLTAATAEGPPSADMAAMAASAESTPYLPFDMPLGVPTEQKVYAHYVPWLPISLDNLPAEQDYYTTQYLNPLGEGGVHAAYGGYLRDRPLARAPIADPNWQYVDVVTEVNQARSVGIDGFAVDIVSPGAQADSLDRLYRAAAATTDFTIQPTADMSGSLASYTPEQFADEFAPYLQSPGSQRLGDGRPVLGAFYAERLSPTWWNTALTTLRTTYGVDVAFVPTFLDAYSNMESFAPFSYGFSSWGGRNPQTTDPTSDFPLLSAGLARRAHELGRIWMQPIAFQDNRPREGVFEESGNTVTNTNGWQAAINEGAEWAQLVTWNDYAEMTAMAPSEDHGWRMLDLQAYYISQFKYGEAPTVVRDALYVSHRSQPAAAESGYVESMPMQLRPGTPAPTDTIDVVVFATDPATVWANAGGQVSSCQVGSGRSVCSFPLALGDIVVGLERDGALVQTVTSPYSVTATPEVQDLQYHVAGGLR